MVLSTVLTAGQKLRWTSRTAAPGRIPKASNKAQKGKESSLHSALATLPAKSNSVPPKKVLNADQTICIPNMLEPLKPHEYVCQPITDWPGSILDIEKEKR